MKIKIHCKYDELIDPKTLKDHPKNRNKHGDDQIERLAEILEYQGFRYAIKISKRSGLITSGHGRKLAAIRKGIKKVPVVFQDYDDEEQEYADVQADNAIASWSQLDLFAINSDMADLGPNFNIDMLGIKGFTLDFEKPEKENNSGELNLEDFEEFQHTCPKCNFQWDDKK